MTETASLDPSYLEDTIGYQFKNKKYLLTFWEMRCLA